MHTTDNSSIDISLIRDTYCGLKFCFKTCVAMEFVDDDDMCPFKSCTKLIFRIFHILKINRIPFCTNIPSLLLVLCSACVQ